jgi:hypothetical protein
LYFAKMTIQMWEPLGWKRKTSLPDCGGGLCLRTFSKAKRNLQLPKVVVKSVTDKNT